MKIQVGDRCKVKVGKRMFNTIVNIDGKQVFFPDNLPSSVIWEVVTDGGRFPPTNSPVLHNLTTRFHTGSGIELNDLIDFYVGAGFPVDHFAILGVFKSVPIVNPLWPKHGRDKLMEARVIESYAASRLHQGPSLKSQSEYRTNVRKA